ncbi:MAG: hypothetical protein MI924_19605 [Chloroflexales bacterium]|nr:hypothetical protein [Chloroflexales bacterium]
MAVGWTVNVDEGGGIDVGEDGAAAGAVDVGEGDAVTVGAVQADRNANKTPIAIVRKT